MHGCSDPFGGRSPSGHAYGRRGCSLLIRLGAFCSYLGSSPARGSLIFAFSMNTYSFLILALLMRRTSGLLGRSPNSHVHGRHGWSLLIRLRAVCPYLGSSPARRSHIFAFLMNTYSILSPARSSLTFAFLMNIYSFLIFAFLMKKTSGLRRSAFSGTGHGCSFLIRLRAVCLPRKEFPYLCLLNEYIQLPYRGRSQPYAWALGPILRTVSEWPCVWRYGCSLLIRLRAFCSYLASRPARSSLIFAFLMNTYSFLSPARSSLIFAFLMNIYSFLILPS